MENQNRIMKCNETRHYKMYKAGKRILYASIAMIACGSWLFLSQDAHAAVNSNVSTTVNAPATGSANNSQLTDKNLGTAAGNIQTNSTSTQTEDPASKDLHTGDSGDAASQTSQNPKALKTIDQLNNQYIDDKGNVSATKPVVTTGGSQTTDSNADMATDITGDLDQTHTSADGSTYYTSNDGNFSGQGGQNKSDNRVAVSKPGEVGDDYGKVYYDANDKQWVKLVSDNTSVAASYSFKNQIDTTSGFDVQGEWSMSKNNPGGGLGVILQPVNPQVAGIGDNSDASIDIGIQNQPNTTFLGFDGYQSQYRDDDDTLPGQLTIRQTDGVARTSKGEYGGGFNQLNLDSDSVNAKNPDGDNPYSTVYSIKEVDPFLGNPYLTTQAQQISDPLDMLFDVNWVPDNSVKTATDETSGTLSVTVYNPDYPSYVAGKVVTSGTKLPKATSIALFGALGGDGKGVLAQGRITSFSLQQVSQQVTVNYINSDTGEAVKPETTINASVGNTLAVNETTTGNTASYGAPVIDGYTFVGAVGTDVDGNYQLADGSKPEDVMQVINTKTLSDLSENKTYNTINVYYKHTGNDSVTRTINGYTTPDKSKSVTEVTQSSFGHVIAVELNQTPNTDQHTTPITDKDGHEIVLTAGSAAVPIQQVKGYTSGYSKNGDNTWTKAKEIPAIPQNGLDNGTYSVQYKADPQSVQVQLIDSDDNNQSVGAPITVKGVTDGSQSYTIAIPANYELAAGAQATGTVIFKAQDNADIQVKVKHQHVISTMTTTNTVTYTGLPNNVTPANGEATVNWNIDTDQVNQNTSYTPADKTSNIATPKVDGYTANDSTIAFDNNESHTRPVNQSTTVAYTANPQSVRIAYVDDNNSGVMVDSPINLTGTTNGTVTWNMAKLPTGYQLADNQADNGTYTFTAAQKQTVDVHLTHVITNDQRTTTRTIDYVVDDSNYQDQAPKDQIQTMSWKVTTDQVTGQSVATSANAYYQVVTPTIAGYTADNSQVAQEAYGSVETSKLPANKTVTVTYKADSQNAQVQYVDDDNNGVSVGTSTSIKGQTNSTITWSATDKLNYDLAKGQADSGSYTFKATDNGPIVIHLIHQHELGTATSTDTVTYTGLPIAPENSAVTVNWKSDTDKVNNKITYTPATGIDESSTVTAPKVDGYTANNSSVTFTNTQSNTQPVDQSAAIAYTANAQSVQVQLIDSDDNDKTVGNPISVNGVTDGSQSYTVTIPTNYELTTGAHATGTVTFKAKDNTNIEIQVRHQHELSAMTTTNTVAYQGLPTDTKQKESITTVNWDVDTDQVNNKATYTPATDSDKTSTVTAPEVDGYTANNSSVTFTNVKSNTQPVDQNATITYTANTQSVQVRYVDDDNNGTLVGTSADVTGQTNSTVTWKADEFTNYGLAKGQAGNGSYTFKADNNAPLVIHLVHQHVLGTATSTDTVTYTGLPTDATPKDSVVNINWKTDTDQVSKQTVYTPDTATETSTINAVAVDGYTAKNPSVTFTNVQSNARPSDQKQIIAYMADPQSVQVRYIDDDNKEAVVSTSAGIAGQTDGTIAWTTIDKPAGYQLADKQAVNGTYTFTAAPKQTVDVHLTHVITNGHKTTTRTINYVVNDLNYKGQAPETQTQIMNWDTTTDQATGQSVATSANAYYQVVTPNIAGYTADKQQIDQEAQGSVDISKIPDNETVTVTYKADSQNAEIQYVDDDNNGVSVDTPTSIKGPTNSTIAWNATDKPNYDLAKGQVTSGSYTFKAADNNPIIVHLVHQHAVSATTTTNTVTYQGLPANVKLADSAIIVNWTINTDKAIDNTTYIPATDTSTITAAIVDGYTANNLSVIFTNAESNNKPENQNKTITYTADPQAQNQAGAGASVSRDDYYDYTQKGQLSATDPQTRAEVPTDAPHVTAAEDYDLTKPGQVDDGIQVRDQVDAGALSVEPANYYDNTQSSNSADDNQVQTQTSPDVSSGKSNDAQPTQVTSDGLSVTSDNTQVSRSAVGKPSSAATSVITDSNVTAVDEPGEAVGASDPVQSDVQKDTRSSNQTETNNEVAGQSKTVTGTNSVTSALTTQSHSTAHSQASIAQKQLPQTNEQTSNRVLSQIGLSLMSLLFVLGIVDKRQKHDED